MKIGRAGIATAQSLQPRVLLLHFLKQRNIRIRLLAHRQHILISLPALGRVAGLRSGAGETDARQHAPAIIRPTVVQQVLEIGHGVGRGAQLKVRQAAQVDNFAVRALIGSGCR